MEPTLLLMDIDMTMVYTGRAGRNAMDRAWRRMYPEHPFPGVPFAGRTDTAISRDMFASIGVAQPSQELVLRYRDLYLEELPACLVEGRDNGGRVLEGVGELLEGFTRLGGYLGLVTGNWYGGAEGKLRHYGLWHHFSLGAFGEDSASRLDLPPLALQRARAAWGVSFDPRRVWIVGDSELDVQCARHNGLRCLAVSTGIHSPEQLRPHGPDRIVASLKDTGDLLEMLGS